MTVNKLISLLQKMPRELQVGFQDHDASDHEVSSWVESVDLLDKDITSCPDYCDNNEKERYDSLPKKVVVLRG